VRDPPPHVKDSLPKLDDDDDDDDDEGLLYTYTYTRL
jgi:hypothetical protein